ncbi:aldehyde dehydrogenase family protein [Microbacterium awajiense]|uniref:aldehyde dehydrogenase family protein n=1 Tax=Microbacterium awajiense TaxID=415214 RepID=UPI0031D9E3D2
MTREVVSPATGDVVGRLAWGGADDARDALVAARDAQQMWAAAGGDARAEWMDRLRERVIDAERELRTAVVAETGKTWGQSEEDYQLLVDSLSFYAAAARDLAPEPLADRAGTHTHELRSEPIGVAVAFVAWNFPLLNIAYKLGPAMAAGAPLVVKPSAKTSLSAAVLGRLCSEVGLPAGVVNLVWGDDVEIGDALSSSEIPALITLIGSADTAKHVMRVASTSVKRFSFELGGNAPVIVLPDADLDRAADIVATLKFANAGQVCVAPNRVLVHDDVADDLVARLVHRAHDVRVGAGGPGAVDMGPLIDEAAADRVLSLVDDAVSAGARVVAGGRRLPDAPTNAFVQPTVIVDVEADMRVAAEEIFGPVIGVQRFSDTRDAIDRANATTAGLSAFVFGSDASEIARCVDALQFGEVHVNGVKYAIELPHGGMKQSGSSCDCSLRALDDYLVTKRVSRPVSSPA